LSGSDGESPTLMSFQTPKKELAKQLNNFALTKVNKEFEYF
jgi:hypothetical protein